MWQLTSARRYLYTVHVALRLACTKAPQIARFVFAFPFFSCIQWTLCFPFNISYDFLQITLVFFSSFIYLLLWWMVRGVYAVASWDFFLHMNDPFNCVIAVTFSQNKGTHKCNTKECNDVIWTMVRAHLESFEIHFSPFRRMCTWTCECARLFLNLFFTQKENIR